ncbi:CDP-alcohol phosphatidyltransferase family protein [Propioniciclava sinopodophylli]|uniref:CDP-alcohol phosphatidyltransferase family protein n=1 Tax=Propioniciclava sinopodophylli TaxID=1837344 RepID=A0A4V2JSA5_9ACTN|nr:CDP-alcohol phosphatidyltransferase family protein [Propioniciclava sinopodophylli]TBT83478.1 CDP-alcohol phosphatidyltransferase family protein [Propioniciclava sinopodophylli]
MPEPVEGGTPKAQLTPDEPLRPWTIPNAVTLLRLLLLVPVCWLIWTGAQGSWIPVVLLAVWASTDWVDGLLARLLDQRSKLGEWLDPFTDRLGIWGLALTLSISGVIGWWVLGIIVVVDMIVAVSAAKAARAGALGVSWIGKSRTAVLFVAVLLVVMGATVWPAADVIGQVLLVVGVVLHVIAALGYITKAQRHRQSLRA